MRSEKCIKRGWGNSKTVLGVGGGAGGSMS